MKIEGKKKKETNKQIHLYDYFLYFYTVIDRAK